ncbi:MAG: hypothetical protein M1826_000426 [Phylliscum demangeonii]|nr:MAG: hypothetical protein M1826_000426 [Phylliscum demangeonii]
MVELRVHKHAVLAKRTTDEESGHIQEDVEPGTPARVGRVLYTPEQLLAYKEEYNAAKRASDNFRNKLRRAKDLGVEVTPEEVDELSRLSAVTYQKRLLLNRASLGKPLDRRTVYGKQDIASIMEDPEIQELAKSGRYSAQQLAEFKLTYLNAMARARRRKRELAEVAKEREITKAEAEELTELQRACNLPRRSWERVRAGKPASYRVDRARKSMEDLLENPKLHELARSSGYSVQELAEAQRRYLDAIMAAKELKRKLLEAAKVREVTHEETTQLQTLFKAKEDQRRIFERMCQGRAADSNLALPRKDMTLLRKDAEIHRIAQQGGYSVEEVAVQKRGYLDAMYAYRDAQREMAAIKAAGRTLTPDEEARFVKIDHGYHLQKTNWDRMNNGQRVDQANPPTPKLGRLGKSVAYLRANVEGAEEDPVAVVYSPQQMALYHRQYLDALSQFHLFQETMSTAQQSGRAMTPDEAAQLKRLQRLFDQRRMEMARVQQGLFVDGLANDGPAADVLTDGERTVRYTARQIEDYNHIHLEALRRLRAAEKQLDAGRQVGRLPTPEEDTALRALRDDFNEKKTRWIRARSGKPVDRLVHRRRGTSERKTAKASSSPRSPANSAGSQGQDQGQGQVQEQASQAKEDPSTHQAHLALQDHQPLQPLPMSGPRRLLAPVLSSASRFLQGLSRQWHAMPWSRRYLAKPRRDYMVKPTDLLRNEHAL